MSHTIASALRTAKSEQHIAALDAEVLLGYVLSISRSELYAYHERRLSDESYARFSVLVTQCQEGVPIAYLTGYREFWSLNFHVTRDTLIPRPETELLVETILQLTEKNAVKQVAELGTGCGAIACALARERPFFKIYATDASPHALTIAQYNASQLDISTIEFSEGYWTDALPAISFDIIVSNPPYIAKDDPHLDPAVLRFEPPSALFADKNGLSDLEKIILSARGYLTSGGYLLLEHGFAQGPSVRALFSCAGYHDVKTINDLQDLPRVTYARWI
jgi:release factor glutamine methyltransferase